MAHVAGNLVCGSRVESTMHTDETDLIEVFVEVLLCGGYNYDSTSLRLRFVPPFDSHSTAIRPLYDHSTTYVTTVGLPVCGLLHCGVNKEIDQSECESAARVMPL